MNKILWIISCACTWFHVSYTLGWKVFLHHCHRTFSVLWAHVGWTLTRIVCAWHKHEQCIIIKIIWIKDIFHYLKPSNRLMSCVLGQPGILSIGGKCYFFIICKLLNDLSDRQQLRNSSVLLLAATWLYTGFCRPTVEAHYLRLACGAQPLFLAPSGLAVLCSTLCWVFFLCSLEGWCHKLNIIYML